MAMNQRTKDKGRKCERTDGNFKFKKKYSLGKLLSWAKQDWLNEHLHIITQILMGEWMNKQLESDVTDASKCSVSEQSS